jgi:hypothetical protein
VSEHDDGGALDPAWCRWIAENLARGASVDVLDGELIAAGVPEAIARACVRAIAAAQVHVAAARRVAALEQIVRLRREQRPARGDLVDRIALPTAAEFRERYWATGLPVVVGDLVTRWPAFGRWGPRDFVSRFGEECIEACVGRRASEDPDTEWRPLRREMTVAELVRRIESAPPDDDVYVTTNNAVLRRPAFAPLLDEIVVPPEIFGPKLDPARMGLWFGPAGTHTTMHHDHANAILCQVLGRKRVRLAPPDSIAMLDGSRGVYNRRDPGDAIDDDLATDIVEVELRAGEALFLPIGWWHQVDALETSISVSIRKFAWDNDYDWYRPGTALAGRGPITRPA